MFEKLKFLLFSRSIIYDLPSVVESKLSGGVFINESPSVVSPTKNTYDKHASLSFEHAQLHIHRYKWLLMGNKHRHRKEFLQIKVENFLREMNENPTIDNRIGRLLWTAMEQMSLKISPNY